MKKSFKKWFTLVEIMIAVAIVAVMAIAAMQYFWSNQMKARDQARVTRMAQLTRAIEEFRNEFYAYPIASSVWSAADFESASGVEPQDAGKYVHANATCTNRITPIAENKIWAWFGKYIMNITEDVAPDQNTKDYKVFMNDFWGDVEWIASNWGIAYKGVFDSGEFKYEIVVPLETATADARMDGGKLGDRFYELGTLVGTDGGIKFDDLGCMRIDGKLPYGIKG